MEIKYLLNKTVTVYIKSVYNSRQKLICLKTKINNSTKAFKNKNKCINISFKISVKYLSFYKFYKAENNNMILK